MKNNERNQMQLTQRLIRATNKNSFRAFEWATIIGVYNVTLEALPPRPCYAILYKDGFVDYLPIKDENDPYEFN